MTMARADLDAENAALRAKIARLSADNQRLRCELADGRDSYRELVERVRFALVEHAGLSDVRPELAVLVNRYDERKGVAGG